MEQIIHRKPSQQPVHPAIRGCQQIVVARMDPRLKVLPTPIGIYMRCPCDGQRMHAVFIAKNVRCKETVLAARTGHYAVIAAIFAAMPVAKIFQCAFAFFPIYCLLLFLGKPAGIANALLVEIDCSLLGRLSVRIFDGRVWSLI